MTCSLEFETKTSKVMFGIVVLSSVLAAQVSPSVSSGFSNTKVLEAINGWKSYNKSMVLIDPAATKEIASTIANQKDLKNQPPISSTQGQAADKRFDLLVGSYLSELRDRKYKEMGSPQLGESRIEVGRADVRAFPFPMYWQGLKGLDQRAALRDPGFLSVTSSPTGAAIKIDDQARGMTDKDFVVSKGQHSVLVKSDKLNCTDSVDVEDDPIVYRCPKQ